MKRILDTRLRQDTDLSGVKRKKNVTFIRRSQRRNHQENTNRKNWEPKTVK